MIPFSLLDLVPIRQGHDISQALTDTAALAQTAEKLGFKRFWTAEHHGADGLAGAAVSVVLAHIGHATSTIRIGAGGIMLPNHNPFVIAEQFGTLDALFPGRIDLGLGRAPGADGRIAHALRKDLMQAAEAFPQDVLELQARFAGDPQLQLQATPGAGAAVEMWLLGSSLFGARLAAYLGMPYAFASHFAPKLLDDALAVYRAEFKPSAILDKPHAMVAMTVIAADTDEEAMLLSSSMDQMFIDFRTGQSNILKPPVPNFRDTISPQMVRMLDGIRRVSAVGGPDTVRADIHKFVERTQADEIIVTGSVYDQDARHRSLALTMDAIA